jgi:PKHD-type hydroxylase
MDLMVDRICRPLGNPGAFTVAAAEFSSSEECAVLRDSIDVDAFEPVTMERDGERVRDVQVLGIDFSAQPEFLDKIVGTLNAVNDLHFRCDLFGVVDEDPPVLVLYRPGQGHYGWHPDAATTSPLRKLTFTLQLSEADSYEGGDLEVQGFGPTNREVGSMTIFPSFFWHRVTPVTAGERLALVGWMHGPSFR